MKTYEIKTMNELLEMTNRLIDTKVDDEHIKTSLSKALLKEKYAKHIIEVNNCEVKISLKQNCSGGKEFATIGFTVKLNPDNSIILDEKPISLNVNEDIAEKGELYIINDIADYLVEFFK